MTVKYFSVLTDKGAARLAKAVASGSKISITTMKLGDGGGSLPEPEASMENLVNTVYSAPLNQLSISASDASQLIAEMIIPEDKGGFWIREIGLFDSDGVMIAVANCPETYKPVLTEGSGRTQTIRMIVVVSSASSVELKVDPSVVLATRAYVEEYVAQEKESVPPLPDVWIPFNDSLDMLTGFAPGYKKITIGDDVVQVASDKQVSFSRASTATYINKSGELKIAEINEPRFERDGLLIEGQRTNYMLNSETPVNWGKSVNMDVPETGTDSSGFTYGKFVCNDSLIGQSLPVNMASVAVTGAVDVSGDNKCVTTSCRFKTDLELMLRIRFESYDGNTSSNLGYAIVNTRSLSVKITGGAADRITARVNKDEVTGWIFAEATIQAIDESYITSAIQYTPKEGGVVESGDYVFLSTPQVENGPCASSFIISGATPATRASDIVTVPVKNNLYNPPFTVLCEVHKNWYKTPNAAPRVLNTSGHQTGEEIILGFGRSTDYDGFPYCDIGGANMRVNENASLEKMVIGMRVKSDQSTCSVSNGRLSGETKTTWSYIQNSAIIRIGGRTSTGERHLFGHIRNFRIWHKELNDRQLREAI
ncbi:phage tail protein [Escherichia coli]|uniref:phage tail protein n=1 Tax=Enterobacteriaceae TaxID=543 RepID=UPI00038FC6CD|nr:MULTISPECIES: phage tail protein [Enterobacteriaceae]EFG7259290.1 phage tail protein [Escherichia coli]EGX9289289.1 phage tail protein [Escherichia coli]EHW6756737.1 phage tail protein [Escherichia coli]EJV2189239.1 phage tail protein [Escherichia coli]EQP55151.1 phage tail fiber protein [Escherichia coli HVH 70 (4-2963531)]